MATYKPIQSIVLSTTATQVLFSNIPQDYTDIVIRSSYTSTADDLPFIRFGSNDAIDAGTNYGYRYLRGNGSTAAGGGASGANQIYVGYSNTGQSNFHIHINGYSNTTLNKVTLSKGDDATNNGTYVYVGEWRNTGAIKHVSINIGNSGASFQAGSTFDLYGIKSGSPKALGGDIVTTDGTYWYHTFNSSGIFTVQQDSALTVNYLVVAGGGAGGVSGGGGGGAGGLRSTVTATGGGGSLESAISLTPQSPYTIQIGAGGAGATSNSYVSNNGTNSFIAGTGITTITSIGGGRGAGYTTAAVVGGSGGGGSGHNASPGNTGAAGTANQGRAGGNCGSGGAGGGGGAGVAASNAGTNSSTAGGAGVAVSITGSSVTYAGGGGGGGWYNPTTNGAAGGSGGGGAGGNGGGGTGYSGTNGTANTGGGGGGGGAGSTVDGRSGSGGSGIVVLRYPV